MRLANYSDDQNLDKNKYSEDHLNLARSNLWYLTIFIKLEKPAHFERWKKIIWNCRTWLYQLAQITDQRRRHMLVSCMINNSLYHSFDEDINFKQSILQLIAISSLVYYT